MSLPETYVIRHGETEWNRALRLQGHLDSPLTALGRAQAKRMGRWLAGAGVTDHVLRVSPLRRARHTAEIIAAETGLQPMIDPDLIEIGVGAWEGLTIDQIAARGGARGEDESHLDWCARAPGGEGLTAILARARAAIARTDRPTILVCHGLFSRVFRAEVLGIPSDLVDGGQGVIHRLVGGRSERIQP